ncbi:MAG: hypothetical protein B7Z78_06220 [Rhodospirillales bacterium 20-60-12]|nr:MAG: hypothetical protein B7Z78_06220 [Rhodospirillales bacterium 20-60-12]
MLISFMEVNMRRLLFLPILLALSAPALAQSMAPSTDDTPSAGAPGGDEPGQMQQDHRAAEQARLQAMEQKFVAATPHQDGEMTLAAAQSAHMGMLVNHFSAIDTQNRGYVTFNQVRAFMLLRKAHHMEAEARQLQNQ